MSVLLKKAVCLYPFLAGQEVVRDVLHRPPQHTEQKGAVALHALTDQQS